MIETRRWALGGAAVAVLLAMTAAGDAAWWPFKTRDNAALVGDRSADGTIILAQAGDSERFNRIENQLRNLTGQVEELTHQLKQLQEQLLRMQQDNEFRFQALEGASAAEPKAKPDAAETEPAAEPDGSGKKKTPVRRVGSANGEEPAVEPEPLPQENPDAIGAITGEEPAPGAEGPGEPPKPLGSLVLDGPPDAGGQPLDLSSLAKGGGGEALPTDQGAAATDVPAEEASIAMIGDPRADYEQSYNLILAGKYQTAESSFRQFLAAYPGDKLAPDAQYWLGESLFARGKYQEAAIEFVNGYKTYPKSGKAPDTLLKLGLSLAGLGERDTACKTYAQVLKEYPKISNALKQRVLTEQASASC